MPTRGQSSSAAQASNKRQRPSPENDVPVGADGGSVSPENGSNANANGSAGDAKGGVPGQSPMFRNVSACNRCRLRKNRCDQNLPSCASCSKANVDCMGFDPITKKNIPRSYVFYLETRVQNLEEILAAHNISYPAAQYLQFSSRLRPDGQRVASATDNGIPSAGDAAAHSSQLAPAAALGPLKGKKDERSPAMLNLATKPRSLASTSGVSFARVVWAAIQHSSTDTNPGPEHLNSSTGGTSMRDSFFGLHTKPSIQPAPFPDKALGLTLASLYFEHANPQIPVLHRPEFMSMLERAYKDSPEALSARELYMLNMVFAIGKGVIVEDAVKGQTSTPDAQSAKTQKPKPEQYHASAIVHLEACLSQSGGYLEVLQAVLLLANFALLRPVPPGLWYITGVAMRLAVDLGLHHEDGLEVESALPDPPPGEERQEPDRGKRIWYRDLKRRLWWCTYSIDRLVSMCVGRPCGISDQVITTELPSLLDDEFITPSGFIDSQNGSQQPSYKHVAHHYFRLRLLQSEILQVLQYNQAEMVRQNSQGLIYPEMHKHLPSPYLIKYDSFRAWRDDIDRRLFHWKDSAPTKEQTSVDFDLEFLELNYWQAILMLYRQSLSVPAMFEGEYSTSDEVNSPTTHMAEIREDEDRVYVKVAEAGRKILRIYRSLHRSSLVSHTYLSTHHLFTAGISYLYAIWHSPLVRSKLMINDVDFTVLGAKSVFTDMIDKCPPAETCRDAFDRTAKATIKMVSQNGGFGTAVGTNSQANSNRQQQPARQRRETWITNQRPDSTMFTYPTGHRHNLSEQQTFPFDFSMSDNLSSPGMSVAGELSSSQATPPVRTNISDPDALMSDVTRDPSMKQDGSVGQGSISSPPIPGPMASADPGFMGAGFSTGGSVDYGDGQGLDFLSTLENNPSGEMGGMDPNQLDLGFGINWEGLHGDYGEGQQMHPFDTFFFGGSGALGGSGATGDQDDMAP